MINFFVISGIKLLFILCLICTSSILFSSVENSNSFFSYNGGDCSKNEVLAWERLRAERKILVAGKNSQPILCKTNQGKIYLALGTGELMLSSSDNTVFSDPVSIFINHKLVDNIQAIGAVDDLLIILFRENNKLFSATLSQSFKESSSALIEVEGFRNLQANGARIVQLADGNLIVSVSAESTSGKNSAEGLVLTSSDGGKSWKRLSSLGKDFFSANLLPLKSGVLLSAVTYRSSESFKDLKSDPDGKRIFDHVVVKRSTDNGQTWSGHKLATRFKESPADLLQLIDGRVILTYGQQNFPYGARAIESFDDGLSWSPQIYLLGYSTTQLEHSSAAKLTSPSSSFSSLALENNTILTIYTRGSKFLNKSEIPSGNFVSPSQYSGDVGKALMLVKWSLSAIPKPALSLPKGVIAIGKPNQEGYYDNGRISIKAEHLSWGGDYYSYEEILRYERIPAEHNFIGTGTGAIVAINNEGNPVVAMESGQLYISYNSGRDWRQIGLIPKGGGRVQSFGILGDGTMLAALTVPVGDITTTADAAPSRSRVVVLRSIDKGLSWGVPIAVDSSPFDIMGLGNCMRIIQLRDKTVIMTAGNLYQSGHKLDLPWDGVFRSRDQGKTWGDFSYIGHPACETNILQLKSGRLLAATRAQGVPLTDDFLKLDATSGRSLLVRSTASSFSDDNGYSWSTLRTITPYNAIPGDLAEMDDGRIVLSYFLKGAPGGARAMISHDQGVTWNSESYMLNWAETSGGHTSSVILPSGFVLTIGNLWSAEKNNYLTEAVVWQPKKRLTLR